MWFPRPLVRASARVSVRHLLLDAHLPVLVHYLFTNGVCQFFSRRRRQCSMMSQPILVNESGICEFPYPPACLAVAGGRGRNESTRVPLKGEGGEHRELPI